MEPHPRVSWIICHGAERVVRDGFVRCPVNGSAGIARCMECHLLETLADERNVRVECRTGDEAIQAAAGDW